MIACPCAESHGAPSRGAWCAGDGAGNRSRSPAPGAYDAALKDTLSERTQRTFNSVASGGKASFGTFTQRGDSRKASEAGDPGLYTVDNPGVNTGRAESISARAKRSFNKDVGAGRGSFNSTSSRSKSPSAQSARGGPGEYDSSHLFSCASSKGMTSSFASATPLGGHVRKSDTPGVGEYEPRQANGYHSKRDGSSAFSGSNKSRSLNANSTTGEHVGPGSYESDQKSLQNQLAAKINPRLPAFGSSSVRTGPED